MQFFERLIAAGEESRLQKLRIRHVSSKDCFVGLPSQLVAQLQMEHALPLAIQLSSVSSPGSEVQKNWHIAWAGSSSADNKSIDVPRALATCLDIPEGLLVSVLLLPQVPIASRLSVEPASEDDWELVEIHADYMEEQLLNQVGVLKVGQLFPFWVRHQSVLYLRVSTAEPANLVKLGLGSELSVAPRPRKRQQLFGSSREAGQFLPPSDVAWLRLQADYEGDQLELRKRSGKAASTSTPVSPFQWHTVNTSSLTVSQSFAESRGYKPGQLMAFSVVPHGRQYFGRLKISDSQNSWHMSVPFPVLASMNLRHHNSVAIQPVSDVTDPPRKLNLHPIAGSCSSSLQQLRAYPSKDLQDLFAAWIQAQSDASCPAQIDDAKSWDVRECGVILHSGSVIQLACIGPGKPMWLFLQQQGGHPGPLKPDLPFLMTAEQVGTGEVELEIGEELEVASWKDFDQPAKALEGSEEIGDAWMLKHVRPCLQWSIPLLHRTSRKQWWKLKVPSPGGLLICGPAGSTRTALARMLGKILAHHPDCQTHVLYVDCQTVEIETLSSAKEQLEVQIQEAVDCMPSLLILDNLHLLCPAQKEGPNADTSDGTPALISWLCHMLDAFKVSRKGVPPLPVVACGTVPDVTDLAPQLRHPGRLDHTVELNNPDSSERQSLFESILRAKKAICQQQDVETVALKSDGYDAADMRAFIDRAIHAAVRRKVLLQESLHPGGVVELCRQDLDAAWEGFSSASTWGLGQGAPSSAVTGWQDVGGMHTAKETLREALELPTKFAKLLARAPLRLRTGVLLYGPPGCGKTHIAAAALAASGARFLSIKGPELLNKYIGASEAAIRDVFRQASAAAPCVLFFDEFDAIAPQRGHDSTGVTDRVVNQLLTELDGVEGLKGVVVLAATSRPDLLDAALLRPGRLDRLVFCGLPSGSERLAILQAHSRRLRLAADVNLAAIAAHSEGFTGADLTALLADAQLSAVHTVLEIQDCSQKLKGQPVILDQHLKAALSEASPSLPRKELEAMNQVYARFRSSREAGVGNKDAKGKGSMRTTLA